MWVRDIWLTKDNNALVFVAQGTKSAYLYIKNGATYLQSQVFPCISTGTSYYDRIVISDDKVYIVVEDTIGKVDIYQYNGITYVFLQTIADAAQVVQGLHIKNDIYGNTYLVTSSADKYARIYKNMNNVFTLV